MSLPEHPWENLAVPKNPSAINARRVNAEGRWDFFWARDSEGRSLLVMRHGLNAAPKENLPKLKGIEVFLHSDDSSGGPSLILRLRDGALRELFHRLCIDIIASVDSADSEREAVAAALARTWRWHHLLRGGGTDLLSPEEQKGLMGELLVLESYFLPVLSAFDALAAWRGPLGEAKDFTVGTVAVESKAHGSESSASVRVSSEFQLDDSGLEALFLHLSLLDPTRGDDEGFTISELAARVRDRVVTMNPRAADKYDALLVAAGFRIEDDYSNTRWTGGERGIYRVRGSFPRIVTATVPTGVGDVKYTLSMGPCGSFLVDPATLLAAIRGAVGVDRH